MSTDWKSDADSRSAGARDVSRQHAGRFAKAFTQLVRTAGAEQRTWRYDEERALDVTVGGQTFVQLEADARRVHIVTEVAAESDEWARAVRASGIETAPAPPLVPHPVRGRRILTRAPGRHSDANRRADSKVAQLKVAVDLGLDIPRPY